MAKLKSKADVIEWYWVDFLDYCLRYNKNRPGEQFQADPRIFPTIDNFWVWYITSGPMGVKAAGRWYTKEDIEYV